MKLCERCGKFGRCDYEKEVLKFIETMNDVVMPRYIHGGFTCSQSVVAIMQENGQIDYRPLVTLTGEPNEKEKE